MFGRDITIEIQEEGRIIIGSNVLFTQNILLSCRSLIEIGDDCSMAEYSSFRDHDHIMSDKTLKPKQLPSRAEPIFIGQKVGIMSNCLILRGAVLPDGVLLGANTIVNRKFKLEKNGIYAGYPPRLIRKRV
jgi:acetyltransferase-like isoleucine patch superfamily enzyme